MNRHQLLDVLTQQGVLITVSVRYWRATQKLRPEDLNLDPDKVSTDLISLGHKKLLPKERLQPFALLESRAHALIEASTFPFLSGLGHYLPNAKLGEVTQRLSGMQGEFEQAKQAFLTRYADLRQEACDEWMRAAHKLVSDPDRLVAAIDAAFPRESAMQRSFGFGIQLFHIRAPEAVQLHCVSLAEQQEIMQARAQAAADAAQQISAQVEDFVGECVSSLRQQTAQLCDEMLASMRESKGGVHQKTLNRLVRFIDEFKKLNFVGDQEMEARLERIRAEFLRRTAEEYRADGAHARQLEAGLTNLRSYARELAGQEARDLVERFGALGQRRLHLAA